MLVRPISSIGFTNGPSSVAAPKAAAGPGSDFGKMLADVAAGATDALKTGEAASIAGVQGKMSTQQVVESVMSAEQALQTAIAVRDKLIGAFQEISRMAI